ncbi:hypothetical protein [Sphingobacterium deserti]|uniref:Uncharacterized protein n=1 Tax=Sphingobacterium deserti TaxID=1229276 RepID=A0A0B8T746_9SPHI|nr:hypothetical protein [Sphingobacterium deserti]KGE13435.1 hypothetical protein DI53_2966 [Sphingobacterium deserti]
MERRTTDLPFGARYQSSLIQGVRSNKFTCLSFLAKGIFMIQRNFYVALLLALSLAACQNETTKTENVGEKDQPAKEQLTEESKKPIIFERQKVEGVKDTLTFDVKHAATFTAAIKTLDGSGSIRINQIVFPDGTTDGPFGDSMTDSLTKTGTYQLIIGESQMQENRYSGAYTVTVELK